MLVAFAYSIYKIICKPVYRLVTSFKKVDEGDLDISITHDRNDEFGYLYGKFNIMVDKFKDLIKKAYEQKILTQKAELKQLQSQINPHFLYNSFFLLYRMSKAGDLDKIEKLAYSLGCVLPV